MFRPCILAIVRLYCKLNKHLYNMCVGYSGGNEISFPPEYPTQSRRIFRAKKSSACLPSERKQSRLSHVVDLRHVKDPYTYRGSRML